MGSGTLLWILLIGGGLFAMFFMHRGGHAHGSHVHGSNTDGGLAQGSHDHDHSGASSDGSTDRKDDENMPAGTTDHRTAKGGKHRHC